jgi:hypothetical protein
MVESTWSAKVTLHKTHGCMRGVIPELHISQRHYMIETGRSLEVVRTEFEGILELLSFDNTALSGTAWLKQFEALR